MVDQVTLVDEHDQVIGVMDKVEAHRGSAQLHRAISVFLFRKNKDRVELLIQQRSPHKIVGAQQWANSVCGNVWPGESYEKCARRRLKNELGITDVNLTPLSKFRYQVQCNDEFSENEIDQVYVGWYEGEVTPNAEEVMRYRWVPWPVVIEASANVAPWFILILQDKKVLHEIEEWLRFNK